MQFINDNNLLFLVKVFNVVEYFRKYFKNFIYYLQLFNLFKLEYFLCYGMQQQFYKLRDTDICRHVHN